MMLSPVMVAFGASHAGCLDIGGGTGLFGPLIVNECFVS